jgi:signal transduction histidine kinase
MSPSLTSLQPGRSASSVRWRFVGLLGGLCAAFLAVLWLLHAAGQRELATQRQQLRDEDTRQLARWLEIVDRSLQELLLDFASLPQTRAMLTQPDPAWLAANLNAALAERQFDALWLLRVDGKLVHLATRSPAVAAPILPEVAKLAALDRAGRRLNFFTQDRDTLWQFRAAPLLEADEPVGWIVAGRRWSEPWLAQLGALTESAARLESPTVFFDETAPARTLQVRRLFTDIELRPLRQLVLERPWPNDADPTTATWHTVLLFVTFGALLAVSLALAVRRWVLQPLELIGASLRQKDPAVIAPLLSRADEFGPVAHLVETAHADRNALQVEIAERQRTEVALRESQENLRHSIELRARLARDLHDHVIQSIYAAGLGLESVRTQLTADPFGAEGRIKSCMANLNETIRTVRSYISDLEPEPPEKRQRFADAVRALTATMHELWPVEFTLELDDAAAATLTNVVEIHALQIVRECLSNALRHGRASRITIRLHASGGEGSGVMLEVVDNGRGFDPVQRMGTGRGLVNLTTRAREIGATLRIDSEEGRGATVRLHLPPKGGVV